MTKRILCNKCNAWYSFSKEGAFAAKPCMCKKLNWVKLND